MWRCRFTPSPHHHITTLFLPGVLHHALRSDLGAVDVAVAIDGHAFGRARAGRFLDGVRNEVFDAAVLRAADSDAALPAVVIARDRFRFRVRGVEVVVLVDVDAARPAELLPLIEEREVLIEDLDAIVVAIADEQPSL